MVSNQHPVMRVILLGIIISFCITSCSISLQPYINIPAGKDLTIAESEGFESDLLVMKRPTQTASPSITPIPTKTPTPIPTTLIPTFTNTSTPLPPFDLCSPLDAHPLEVLEKITSDPYNPPAPGKDFRHHGVDFSHYSFGEFTTIKGIGVQTVLPGLVSASIADSFPFGNMVIVETPYSYLPEQMSTDLMIFPGESLYMLYAHMEDSPTLSLGEQILACKPIGKVGRSGNAGIYHLHLETRVGKSGAQFPVMGYYLEENTTDEIENYLLWRTSGEFRHFDPMMVLDLAWVPGVD